MMRRRGPEKNLLRLTAPFFKRKGRPIMGEKEYWRAGNMLYPIPAVMVSCQRGEERPNIITVAWTGTGLQRSGNGLYFRASRPLFL